MAQHKIVVGLGFGDEGKGSVVDYLVRETGAKHVVRYNGGAQAAHNVVSLDGRHHTFAQFGSGSFIPETMTYLTQKVIIDPLALLEEVRVLESKGVKDPLSRIRIHRDALVITPAQQKANQIRELLRGGSPHGSCGIGIGETRADALVGLPVMTMKDLESPSLVHSLLHAIRQNKAEWAHSFRGDFHSHINAFEDPEGIDEKWVQAIQQVVDANLVVDDTYLQEINRQEETIIWEGAQGVLLDEWWGFHPHTTWSTTTTKWAEDELKKLGVPDNDIKRIGVLRSYMTRHGAGPLPSETEELASLEEKHNATGQWQGSFRKGWFDYPLALYALEVCPVDTLALTHLDAIEKLPHWKIATSYKSIQSDTLELFQNFDDKAIRIRKIFQPDWEQRLRLTQELVQAQPNLWEYPDATAGDFAAWVERNLYVHVGLISMGPTSKDKFVRGSMEWGML